jgi:hypothetical protein
MLHEVQDGGGHTEVITDALGLTSFGPKPGVMFRTLKHAIDATGTR